MNCANLKDIKPKIGEEQHFPTDGLYIGSLRVNALEFPALVFLRDVDGICLLNNDFESRESANKCLERLVWRIVTTIPPNMCEISVYNGGNPGDAFNSIMQINKYFFGEQTEKIYFAGTREAFSRRLEQLCGIIVHRMSKISGIGAVDAVEYNERVELDERMKYMFLFISDFPRYMNIDMLQRLEMLIHSGRKAGIYVMMAWNMTAEFENKNDQSSNFDPRKILETMMLIFPTPQGGGQYNFKNSGHDKIFNKYTFEYDDSLISAQDISSWGEFLNQKVEEAKKLLKPKVQKQDFGGMQKRAYEPISSDFSVTIGKDVEDAHVASLRFNSIDYIHAFILGQSGSGKSVLLNNIITSEILKYSPEDLMLYLMDFKGVEFTRYRGVKHAKAILVDNSDQQMTLEVLRELHDENKKRVKIWQREGVNNINDYNRKHSDRRLPQILFVADECQVMFKASASFGAFSGVQREISDILNVIATQGRSQGIHMLLATQQLDETDISGQVLKNLTECILLASAPADSERLVPDSSDKASMQPTGRACYYHKKEFKSQVQTFYATNEELEEAITAARAKAAQCKSNGEYFFCGSSLLCLKDDISAIADIYSRSDAPVALLGRKIGLGTNCTSVSLIDDYSENILFFGTNKQEQTVGGLMNALISLMLSYKRTGTICDFIVIDCMNKANARYKELLSSLERQGLCRVIPRLDSGNVLAAMVDAVENGTAHPTVVSIIGNEHFVELKKDLPLPQSESQNDSSGDNGFDALSFDMGMGGMDSGAKTFRKALEYLLEEGPLCGVHFLLQVDKPGNIMFKGEYGDNAVEKFKHKIIYRSENKCLVPLRLSKDIDVETLGEDEERLRAYYCAEGEEPVLFTPYQMPEDDMVNLINK